MEVLNELVERVSMYLKVEEPFYTKRISYYTAQLNYAKMLISKGYEPSPKQLEVFTKNLSDVNKLLEKLLLPYKQS